MPFRRLPDARLARLLCLDSLRSWKSIKGDPRWLSVSRAYCDRRNPSKLLFLDILVSLAEHKYAVSIEGVVGNRGDLQPPSEASVTHARQVRVLHPETMLLTRCLIRYME